VLEGLSQSESFLVHPTVAQTKLNVAIFVTKQAPRQILRRNSGKILNIEMIPRIKNLDGIMTIIGNGSALTPKERVDQSDWQ
jgi:hypothetical protein